MIVMLIGVAKAVGAAITALLVWGIANAALMLELLTLIAAGVGMFALIRTKAGVYGVVPVS